ncbi:MAG: DivIVA domain-containing protein [Actinomycetota bacterium]|nr:DivIVA domain-containing protein [Actinomycetota bacterium]
MSTEDALGAEEVASKEFPVTFRGFGQHEVRAFLAQVAAELAAARERERLQRERLEAAEARAAAHTPTEQEIEAALGQEAGRLLHAAREGAAEIRAKAQEEAARLVREATGEGRRTHEEAESLLARRSEEAEKEAAEIRAEAQREAEAHIEKAKAEGREMVAEAQAVRERILKDLVRRRRVAHQHLEQLRAGRERLVEAYRVVRSTLDEATRELSVAEVEARAAAETAALRAGARPEPSVEELESELSAARDAGLTVARSGSGSRRGAEVSGNGPGAGAEAGAGWDAPPDDVAVGVVVERERRRDDDDGAGSGAGEEEPEVRAPFEPVGTVAPQEVAEALADVVQFEPQAPEPVAEDAAAVPVAEAVERPGPEPLPVEDNPAAPSQRSPESDVDVDSLFARIRADREAAVARAEAVLSEPVPEAAVEPSAASAEVAPDRPVRASDAAPPADDEHLLQERDAQMEPLERVLLRSLKRALADEQNEVLDTLRRHPGPATLADLLPAPGDHVARYLAVVGADLEAAAIQGARGAGGGEAPSIDDLAGALAGEVADDLRARLERAIDAADGDEAPVQEAISSAYREWKTSWAEPLVRHHLAAAHARGRFAAVPAVALRWVVDDDEGACPDCDDNALAGPTPKGQPFPTGQQHPPAHVGCRCMVVPEPA